MSYLLIHVFFICFNIALGTVSGAVGVNLGEILEPNNAELAKKISTPKNGTTTLDFLIEGVEQAGATTQLIFNALSGGFVIDVIENVGVVKLPNEFKNGIQGLLMFLLAIQLFYLLAGKPMTRLT